jgi:predicted Ser/Thr protein kinase
MKGGIYLKDFELIQVGTTEDNQFKIINNPYGYELIGVGQQGAVFQITPEHCVKLFYRSISDRKSEEEALKSVQGSPFFPKVVEVGNNYIVMEYIMGADLKKYIKKEKKIPDWLVLKILEMLREMKRLNLTRVDADLRHIIVVEEHKTIKVIDHVNSFVKKIPYPKHLFKGLSKLGYFEEFINKVKNHDKDLYYEWKQMGKINKYKKSTGH